METLCLHTTWTKNLKFVDDNISTKNAEEEVIPSISQNALRRKAYWVQFLRPCGSKFDSGSKKINVSEFVVKCDFKLLIKLIKQSYIFLVGCKLHMTSSNIC